jgi:hypothetical protein
LVWFLACSYSANSLASFLFAEAERFIIYHDFAIMDKTTAERQAHWVEKVLPEEHESVLLPVFQPLALDRNPAPFSHPVLAVRDQVGRISIRAAEILMTLLLCSPPYGGP